MESAYEEHFAVSLREVALVIPDQVSEFMRDAIMKTGGNEVFFVTRVQWDDAELIATVDEVEVAARGNEEMVPAVVGRANKWDLVIHNHPSGNLDPSGADIRCAGMLANDNIGFAIINNDASEQYIVVKPNPHGIED